MSAPPRASAVGAGGVDTAVGGTGAAGGAGANQMGAVGTDCVAWLMAHLLYRSQGILWRSTIVSAEGGVGRGWGWGHRSPRWGWIGSLMTLGGL